MDPALTNSKSHSLFDKHLGQENDAKLHPDQILALTRMWVVLVSTEKYAMLRKAEIVNLKTHLNDYFLLFCC